MVRVIRLRCAITIVALSLVFCVAPQSWADKNSREAVEALEAYAVYKMAIYDEAFERFMSLAKRGNHQGMLNVAGMLAAGLGTDQNLVAAFGWYLKSATEGNPIGMYYVAEAYQNGHGVEQDHDAALHWYQKASHNGAKDAQVAVARLLLDNGSIQQATEWLERWSGTNSDAADLLKMVSGNGNLSGNQVTPLNRVLIGDAWKSIDRSARAGNAHGVVYFLDHDADVQIRLPGLAAWTKLKKDELRALWQRSFDSSDQYKFSRSELLIERITDSSNRYKVVSTIHEVLPAGLVAEGSGEQTQSNSDGNALTISETAIVLLIDSSPRITEIKLDISSPSTHILPFSKEHVLP